jgi:LacI family transcriptional regulator
MISIKDIAQLAEVSVSTVSRVINGNVYVSEDKRRRIEQAIAETGFVPNRAARDMVRKSTSKVGIFLPDTFNQFQRQLFSEIAHNLENLGYYSSFFFVPTNLRGEQTCLQKLKSERLDGVLLLREIELPEFREYLNQNQIPTVLVTFENAAWANASSVHIRESEAADVATSYLISLGHRRIAMIGGKRFSFGAQREAGYRNALKRASIPLEEALFVYVEAHNAVGGSVAMSRLLERKVPFTAVFAHTDEVAIGCIRQLEDRGFSIPRDISVAAIDDIEMSSYLSPRLTTIRQPLKEMGRLAVSMLHDHIRGNSSGYQDIALPSTLIRRDSTDFGPFVGRGDL